MLPNTVTARSKVLVCWRSLVRDCGFESRRGHGSLSLVSVVILLGRGLCVGLITRPEESYRMWCVVCDLETSRIGAPYIYIYIYIYDISSLRVNHFGLPDCYPPYNDSHGNIITIPVFLVLTCVQVYTIG